MRRAAKVDANQPAIVAGLRKVGYLVQSLAAIGDGAPDLLVFDKIVRRFTLLEVKNGDRKPWERKLRKSQETWHALGWPVAVVNDLAEALVACDPLDVPVKPITKGRHDTRPQEAPEPSVATLPLPDPLSVRARPPGEPGRHLDTTKG